MENLKRIVIADPDIEYLKHHEEEFLLEFGERASIQIITEREYLENYFRVHREIDVLLIAGDFYGDYLAEHDISHIMVLDEERIVGPDEENAPANIINYKSRESVFSFVEHSLSDNNEMEETEVTEEKIEAETTVVAVYSPVGGSGKSLASIALARKLKKLGETVLLIGCDDLQSFSVFLNTRENADPELAVKLRDFAEDTYWSVLKNIYMDETSFLLPFEQPLSSLGIGAEQLLGLVGLLKEKKDFSYIILDLGSAMNKEMHSLIALSDVCIFITESKMTSCRMMEKFMMNTDIISAKKHYFIANQYRTEGFRLERDNLFGSFAGYNSSQEAMEDPLFYRLALELVD